MKEGPGVRDQILVPGDSCSWMCSESSLMKVSYILCLSPMGLNSLPIVSLDHALFEGTFSQSETLHRRPRSNWSSLRSESTKDDVVLYHTFILRTFIVRVVCVSGTRGRGLE